MFSHTETCFYTFSEYSETINIGFIYIYIYIYIYIFLSFIDHSFEERKMILKRKQCEGNMIDIKLI